jgi:hypothetical protein
VAFCDRDGERGQPAAAELETAGAKVASCRLTLVSRPHASPSSTVPRSVAMDCNVAWEAPIGNPDAISGLGALPRPAEHRIHCRISTKCARLSGRDNNAIDSPRCHSRLASLRPQMRLNFLRD